jgi:hypothetical protein
VGALFEEIKGNSLKKGTKPIILSVLEKLSKDEKTDLIKAINDHSISASSITRALAKRDIKLPADAIGRYRRGETTGKIDGTS